MLRDSCPNAIFESSSTDSIVRTAVASNVYNLVIVVERTSTTFGLSGVDDQLKNGKTIVGKLLDSDQEVQLHTMEARNASLRSVFRGDRLQATARVTSWDTLYDRLVLHEVSPGVIRSGYFRIDPTMRRRMAIPEGVY